MPLLITVVMIGVLLFLIMRLKVQALLALTIVSLLLALVLGIPLDQIAGTIEKGFGDTLQGTGLVFVFGAVVGKLLADAGGAQQLSTSMIHLFGEKRVQWAVMVTSFILGIALFFNVGLVLLIPIIFQIHKRTGKSLMYLALPMIVALSVTHGFLPPHPGPTAIATVFGANEGEVLLYGMITALPTTLLAGPVFTWLLQRYKPGLLETRSIGELAALGEVKDIPEDRLPGFTTSAITAAMPVILMLVSTVIAFIKSSSGAADNLFFHISTLIGQPTIAMLIAVVFALFSMGVMRQRPLNELASSVEAAVRSIAVLLIIIGVSGSFKQVLLTGGVGDYVKQMFEHSALSPLLLAWLIAVMLRLAQGSATVASLSAAALALPLMQADHANPALMVLATGAGSIFFSHFNDTGFWMIKESFGLSIKQTFATWSVLETLISVFGLIIVLLLSLVVPA